MLGRKSIETKRNHTMLPEENEMKLLEAYDLTRPYRDTDPNA